VKSTRASSVLSTAGDLTDALHPSNANPSHADPRSALIERVIASTHFRSSLRLREILLYIAECALRGTPEAATEQQIGVHVFHRPPGYNSSEDSIVRTHARLLRQKLAEYFSTEGSAEPLIVEVPKGHYLPIFRLRESAPRPQPVALSPEVLRVPDVVREPVSRNWRSMPVGVILGALLVLTLAALGFLFFRTVPNAAAKRSPVEVFWGPFLSGEPPVVIYSNTRFLGDSKTGLRYAPTGGVPTSEPVVDHYTGIGEVAAVYELTRLFDAHRATFILKRSLLVTWDEAKSRNLIFIGSAAENPSLHALPSLTDFTMVATPESAGFVNNHPRPGELPLYTRPEHPLAMDFAVIALTPGVEPGKRTLVFSGLTTLGTQAAVEYASQKDTVSELCKLVCSPAGEVKSFEALLQVTLEGGVPLQSKLVAIRVH
jgi:hypothetical protein